MKVLKTLTKKQKLWIVALVSCICATCVVLIGFLNANQGLLKLETSSFSQIQPSQLLGNKQRQADSNFNGVGIIARLLNFDFVKGQYLVHFDLYPLGSFVSPQDHRNISLQSSTNVTININANTQTYLQGQEFSKKDETFSIEYGDVNSYPFDVHGGQFFVAVTVNGDFQPVAVEVGASVQTYSVYIQVQDDTTSQVTGQQFYGRQWIDITIQRSFTAKFFSLFIISTMWILSIIVFILASSLCMRDKKAEGPIISMTCAMLFALPTVRNIQPGVPAIGCTADVVGFFWNMVIVALSVCMLMINYISRTRLEKVKKSNPLLGDKL